MKRCLRRVLLALLWPAFTGPAAADPPPGFVWKPVALLTDEFTAAPLDSSKWKRGNPQWEGHEPGLFKDANVNLKDGLLQITMKAEQAPAPDGRRREFTTGSVHSRTLVRYGYFEVRARAMKSRGSSAFWFFRNEPAQWTEIDVCELSGTAPKQTGILNTNARVFHAPGLNGKIDGPLPINVQTDLAADFHVYALEWDAERLTWYFNDRPVRRVKNTHWHQALHLMLDSNTLPAWFGLPDKKELPSTFSIDYVRAWQKGA